MAQVRGGCLTFIVATVIGMVAAGYISCKIAEPFTPPGDDIFATQIGVLAAIDALSAGVLAWVANAYGIKAKQYNPAVKVICGFACLGVLCGHGYGLGWLFGTGAVNGLVGLLVWLVVIRPVPTTSENSN